MAHRPGSLFHRALLFMNHFCHEKFPNSCGNVSFVEPVLPESCKTPSGNQEAVNWLPLFFRLTVGRPAIGTHRLKPVLASPVVVVSMHNKHEYKPEWERGAPAGSHCCAFDCRGIVDGGGDPRAEASWTLLNPPDGGGPLPYCDECRWRVFPA